MSNKKCKKIENRLKAKEKFREEFELVIIYVYVGLTAVVFLGAYLMGVML